MKQPDYAENQLDLFGLGRANDMKAKTDKWIRDNHEVWFWMLCKANEYAHDKKRFGIGALCEEARWHMKVNGVDGFKINNDIRAELARRLIAANPHVKDVLETRRSICDL